MSLMVAHRGGAPCLGQGPSPSPQGPHTATPSLPLWHPSSTGESLGMGGIGDRGTWGCGGLGTWGCGGHGDRGRQAGPADVAMGNDGVGSGGSAPKGRFPLDLEVLGFLRHPWELVWGRGQIHWGIGCPGTPCHETSVPRQWQSPQHHVLISWGSPDSCPCSPTLTPFCPQAAGEPGA